MPLIRFKHSIDERITFKSDIDFGNNELNFLLTNLELPIKIEIWYIAKMLQLEVE